MPRPSGSASCTDPGTFALRARSLPSVSSGCSLQHSLGSAGAVGGASHLKVRGRTLPLRPAPEPEQPIRARTIFPQPIVATPGSLQFGTLGVRVAESSMTAPAEAAAPKPSTRRCPSGGRALSTSLSIPASPFRKLRDPQLSAPLPRTSLMIRTRNILYPALQLHFSLAMVCWTPHHQRPAWGKLAAPSPGLAEHSSVHSSKKLALESKTDPSPFSAPLLCSASPNSGTVSPTGQEARQDCAGQAGL